MCNILETLKSENKLTYIIGDFNINLFNYDSHTKTADFINLMFSYSYAPFINKPTRITEQSSTLIDNIFVNNYNDNTFQGLLFTDISDHFPVFIINKKIKCENITKTLISRDYCQNNIKHFLERIQQVSWATVMNVDDTEFAYNRFQKLFLEECELCFPLKTIKVKYKNRKPWLTSGLKTSIKEKNRLYIIQKKKPYLYNKVKYKTFRNKLNNILAKAERKHYDILFNDNKNNLVKSWSLIKDIINKHKSQQSQKNFINDKQECLTDSKEICNAFNNFFY